MPKHLYYFFFAIFLTTFAGVYISLPLETTSALFKGLSPKNSPEKECKELQPFIKNTWTYFGKGAQSYAFESEDGKYVLKLFKFKHFRPNFLEHFAFYIPDSLLPSIKNLKKKILQKKQSKFNSVFEGYRLAYDKHKEESALIFVHLTPSDNLNAAFKIIGPMGFTQMVPCDETPFVIQKKGIRLKTIVTPLLQEGKFEEALGCFDKIFELYYREYQKGLFDRDHGVTRNLGLVDGAAFHLDVGKLSFDPKMKNPEFFSCDLDKVKERIEPWLASSFPEFLPYFRAYYENKKRIFCKRASQ